MTGPELRTWRLARGYTQSSLGDWLGVAENTVRQWESARRRVPKWAVKKIKEAE